MMLLFMACHQPDLPMKDGVGGNPDTTEQIVGDDTPLAWFDDAVMHTVDLELPPRSILDLNEDPYTYTTGTVTVDGVRLEEIGVRLRGKYGSFRQLSGKPKFKLDLNRYRDQDLRGLEQLALNNEVVDCSYLRESTGYAVFRAMGLPAPRTAYTQVTVNGEDYGVYVLVEFPDDSFLADRYDDGSGNLYDGKYLYDWETGNYAMVDFTRELVGNFVLEEGTDVANADVNAVAEGVFAEGSFAERLGGLVDTDNFHRHLIAEQLIGHVDGYALNSNNYRVYFDPEDGRADLLTYDLDYAFYEASSWGMDWRSPRGRLVEVCWRDAGCRAAHRLAVDEMVAELDLTGVLEQMAGWSELIGDAVRADPKRECTEAQIGPQQRGVRAWVEGAVEEVDLHWRE